MIYLFKNRFSCTDVFRALHEKMVRRGYSCVRVIDEDLANPKELVDALRGRKVTLITSDHLSDDMKPYGKNGYSVNECVEILKPVKKFFGMHDLGVSTIDDKVDGYTVLLPGENWGALFPDRKNTYVVGHGKFTSTIRDGSHGAVFFVSSVYVYNNNPKEFLWAFGFLIKLGIPFKFPRYPLGGPLAQAVLAAGGKVIDTDLESFDLLLRCHTAISNANSSIAVEACMAGCRSVNLGWSFVPSEVYKAFEILSVNDRETPVEEWRSSEGSTKGCMEEYVFKVDRCIEIVSGEAENGK